MAEDRDEAKRRTEVRDLPRPEKELSTEEQKEVKGGFTMHHIVSDGAPGQTTAGKTTEANAGCAIDPNGQA